MLGRGGMGTVFSAFDESTGERVALKRLTPGAPPRMLALFEREFYVLSSLRHPRIIDVYDYGVDKEGPYYTMELLAGSDLRELSPAPPRDACRYLRDVASSLALLHVRRLLHRDVSPRNVRTRADGRCKLIDFGALMSFGTSDVLVGTPPAIPPEALSAEPMDQRADLFSLGALAYFLLTGRHAYPAQQVTGLADAWQRRVAPPSRHAPEVPPELDHLVLALLSLDVLGRPSSAAEVIDRLNAIGGLEPEHDVQAERAYFVGGAVVERAGELQRVERRLQSARIGKGGALFIDAESGAGKTRFLSEAVLRAQLVGAAVLRADASAHSGPFSTMRALARQLLRLRPGFATKLFAQHAEALGAFWAEVLSDLPHEGKQGQGDPNPPSMHSTVLPALEACFREVARKTVLVLAVDNVDRADPESAALLLSFSRIARTERLLVLTTGPVHSDAEFSLAVRAIRGAGTGIRLRDLTEGGAEELVRTAFGDVPHVRRTAKRLFTATNGNPERCMRLLQRWVASGLIHYTAGAWSLPLEIPADALSQGEHSGSDPLEHCSEGARRVAAMLAVVGGPVPLDSCVAFEAPILSSREVIESLEELVEAEVLSLNPEGYRFRKDQVRASALESVGAPVLRALNGRVGESMLTSAAGGLPQTRIAAGLCLIRGGDEIRGAELIAGAARAVVADARDPAPLLAKGSEALEAALDVYRKAGRSSLSQLELLVPLVLASYEISPAFVTRYADETISRLERALALPPSSGEAVELGEAELLAALRTAPVLEPGEEKTENTPDVVVLVGWLVRCVMTVIAAMSAAIDHEVEARFASALRPFAALGPNHPAAIAHEYCRLIIAMTEDRLALCRRGWLDLLPRISASELPAQIRRRLLLGALYSLGILDCYRDDDAALVRMREIEELATGQSIAVANQLRFLYHGFRGERALAEQYRDRVEAHAVQYGSAWQVEIWSTTTASAVYGNARDIAGSKRVVDQLERLKKTSPSLELFWERAVAGYHAMNGRPAIALEIYERIQARSAPRERVGWCAIRGKLAYVYNELGRHETARRLCEETLVLCEEDLDFVAFTLAVRVELCRALAGLGEFAAAEEGLAALFSRYARNENPMTLGILHRTGAEVARLEGDTAAFDHHLGEMRAWFQPTQNPALIAQCDRLRNLAESSGGWEAARSGVGTLPSTSLTFAQSVLAGCEGAEARKQRVLELVADRIGTNEAWLFTGGGGDEPAIVGRLGVSDAPTDLFHAVSAMFEEAADEADETAFVENSSDMETIAAPPQPSSGYRLLPLLVNQGAKILLVGAIGVPAEGAFKAMGSDFLRDVATQLFVAGDVTSIRTIA